MCIKDLEERASKLAFEYERDFGGCAQCVLASIRDSAGGVSDDVFKSATGLACGIARTGHACGACIGGAMAIASFWGRAYDNFADPAGVRQKTFDMCLELVKRFEKEYGSCVCKDIQTKLMGRWYDLKIPEEKEKFLAAGGHDDKCTGVCANAAKWVIEILAAEGLVK